MFSATDIASFLACPHTATLARAESKKQITKPFFANPSVDLLQKLGLEHEQRYLRELAEKDGLAITQIDVNGRWEDAVAETVRALREGVDAVYQATFLDAPWGGRSDFLVRVNKPSALGAWSYEVVETKLARSTKPTALVQLCFYSDLLSRIQGVDPLRLLFWWCWCWFLQRLNFLTARCQWLQASPATIWSLLVTRFHRALIPVFHHGRSSFSRGLVSR